MTRSTRKGTEKIRCASNSTRSGADRRREVEDPAGLDHAREVLPPLGPAVDVDRISVASETEVLQGMQARERIGAGVPGGVGAVMSRSVEHDVLGGRRQWPDIDDLDRAERRDVGPEAVDARSDVDVARRPGLVNPARRRADPGGSTGPSLRPRPRSGPPGGGRRCRAGTRGPSVPCSPAAGTPACSRRTRADPGAGAARRRRRCLQSATPGRHGLAPAVDVRAVPRSRRLTGSRAPDPAPEREARTAPSARRAPPAGAVAANRSRPGSRARRIWSRQRVTTYAAS